MRIIDCHVHLTRAPLYGRGSKTDLLASLQTNGVERALVMGEAKGGEIWFSSEQAASAVRDDPRLGLIFGVDVEGDIPMQAARARDLIASGIAVAFKLYPGYQYFYPGDARLKPIMSVAQQTGVPIVIHTGDLFVEGTYQPPLLKYSHPLHVDEVASLHPEVMFIIAHLGNPWILDATEVLFKNKNVFADLSGLFAERIEPVYAALIEKRLCESIAFLGGADRFLFGTDWPLIGHGELISFFKKVIPKEDQAAFFFGNAERLFRLSQRKPLEKEL